MNGPTRQGKKPVDSTLMHLRLLDRLARHATLFPNAPAIVEVGSEERRTISYAELEGSVNALAHRLIAQGRSPGEIVLLSASNQAEFIVAFLALLAAGMRVFPVSPDLTLPELENAAARSGAAGVIGSPGVLESLGTLPFRIPIESLLHETSKVTPARSHESAGLLLQSSGTTGRPKIVFRSAASLDAVSEQMVDSIGWQPTDRALAVVPLCHSYGLEHGLLCPIWAGSAVHLCRGFDLRIVRRELSEHAITLLPGVPFMFEMLAHHASGARFPELRRAYSAGGPLPRSVYDAFEKQIGVRVSQLYGATEIGSVTYADPDAAGFDPASVGRAMKGVHIRIATADQPDAREVHVRAASMMSGSLEDELSPDLAVDYFPTGDLGRLDDFGNLTLTGRLKLLIDIGGLKVNPIEVEDALAQHPEVDACIVVPVRVSETVNRLKAIVTPRDLSALPTAESLRRFARERLVAYKVPRAFEVRPSLPKSPTGKILRQLVEP